MSHVVRSTLVGGDHMYRYSVSYWDPQSSTWKDVEVLSGEDAKSKAYALCSYLNGGN